MITLLSFLLWAIVFYLASGIAVYFYAVFKSWEITEIWDFKIGYNHIGICVYPRWLMAWLRWIYKKIDRMI